jgi:[ribosomal protein S5]-alanine N-acetyltransferase
VDLIPLSADALLSLADGGSAEVAGVRVTWPADDMRVLGYRRHALLSDAESAPYLLHVVLEDGTVVARIGCHEGPRDGVVEIGYAVAPTHRRQGLATAMVRQFLSWLALHGVATVRASVSPGNTASRALLDRLGFVEVGSHVDEEDGLELELALDLSPAG